MKLLRAIDRFFKWLLSPADSVIRDPRDGPPEEPFPWLVAISCLLFGLLVGILTLASLRP